MTAIRTIEYTASPSGVKPIAPQDAGVRGEHKATNVVFNLDASLIKPEYKYRFEYVDGFSGFDTTEFVQPVGSTVSILLPVEWTAGGGCGTLRLCIVALDSQSNEEQTIYTFPASLLFAERETGGECNYKKGLSALIAGAGAATDAANEAAESANAAADKVDESVSSANTAAANANRAAASADASAATASAAAGGAQEAKEAADTAASGANTAAEQARTAAASANTAAGTADTAASNANAVAELVVGALVAGSRNLVDAVNWAQTLKGRDTIAKDVEKGKKAFVGPELRGKTLGVIGLGAIGARVANAAVALGMEVLGYDPYISIDAAWSLSRSVQHCVTLGDMLPRCDYLTIHVPYLPTTRHTINAQTLAMCKDGVRVLNFARGELVDNAALLDALNSGKVAQYFCDFPTEELLGVKGVCCTPHLGASTPESETNCAVMAAAELSDYLKNGNISHSVNLPDVSQPRVGGRRICIIHKNAPGAISAITSILTEAHLNIENMVNKGKKDVAYTLLDVTGNVTDDLAVKLGAIEPAIRVRVL